MSGSAHRLAIMIQLLLAIGLGGLLIARGWSAAAAVATAAAALPVAYLAVVAQHFVAARLAGGPPAVGAARLGPWRAARMVLAEAAGALRAFGWLMPFRENAPLAAPRKAGHDPKRVPVLLLHGYLCNRGMWRPFARHLAECGHPVEAITLAPAFGSIDAYAEPVAAAVQALRRRTGAERVAVVGHSMGGLALRAYLRRCGAGSVAAAVTLGTPHAGTRLARFGYGRNARQMREGSDWLRRLAQAEAQANGPPFTVVLTRHDNIVVPQAVQTLSGAETVELSGIGHMSLAFDAGVMRIVSRHLAATQHRQPADAASPSARAA